MSPQIFEGKVVIFTGSSSGIGQAAAFLFAKNGASVTIHGRSEEGLQKTADLIEKAGIGKDKIHSVKGSITDDAVLKALIDETVAKFGRLDILINNAAVPVKEGEKNPRSMESFDYLMNVNLKSVIHLTELAIPHLEKSKGNIVNVSSIVSQKTNHMFPFYNISKAALDHFARNYAAILAPKGIRVNNLNPGLTDTSFIYRAGITQEAKEKFFKTHKTPLGRCGNAEEMAEFLVFMASEKASYMTGQCINVDGGSLVDSSSFKLD